MDPAPRRSVVRFGPFEVNLEGGELRKSGMRQKLAGQPFEVLRLLLEHPQEIVTREELQHRIWPKDTFVDYDLALKKAVNRIREVLGDSADSPHFIETVPRRGYRFIGTIQRELSPFRSLAILPLEDLSHDPEQEYFAEGMTEALIAALAKISALRVTSRTTVMCYKGRRQPLPTIAQELGVDVIIEGTVLRSGPRIRISVQLIETSTDSHLWAETYERDLSDVLTLQSEVARNIAREIQVKLTPQEQALLGKARAIDPEAYEAYLKGRYHWNRRSGEGLKKATRCFRQAIAKDANYAPAYSGLADCANSAGWWCFVSPEEGCGKAQKLAKKALAIDQSLSEAHSSLGFSLLFYDFDFLGAEQEFRLALDLNPENATAAEWHASWLGMVGRFDQCVSEILHAVRLDPLSPIIATIAGNLLFLASRYDESIEMGRTALELDPAFSLAEWPIVSSLMEQGRIDVAVSEIEEVVRLTSRMPFHLHVLGSCYARVGKRDEALGILQELRHLAIQCYIPDYWSAIIYAGLNQKDEAFRCLETAYVKREPWMPLTKNFSFSFLASLRSHPRFDDLLRRMNFPSSSS